jgi:putative intracellular protease/amidase
MRKIIIVLFDDFETLDVFGPVEILGSFKNEFKLEYYSIKGGNVTSTQGVSIITKKLSDANFKNHILFIPGGMGVRELIYDLELINTLSNLAKNAEYILTVCTGSALFAKTDLLNNKRATSNKKAFAWTTTIAKNVLWVKKARWVKDTNIYTSSVVSAGIDMTLSFISNLLGYDVAKQISIDIEYNWQEDSTYDNFADMCQGTLLLLHPVDSITAPLHTKKYTPKLMFYQ